MSPFSSSGTGRRCVWSTTAAGTISQTARGFSSFFTRSASDEAPDRLLLGQVLHHLRRPVEDHALMTTRDQPPHHVRAHAPQSDHSELHSLTPLMTRWRGRVGPLPAQVHGRPQSLHRCGHPSAGAED